MQGNKLAQISMREERPFIMLGQGLINGRNIDIIRPCIQGKPRFNLAMC